MSEVTMRWHPISELPEDFDKRPSRQFIRVEGWKEHSGAIWHRVHFGTARVQTDELGGRFGYRQVDIHDIRNDGDMDSVDRVTHWMPAQFPEI